jgi:solute carrier family 25 phosphate transporter 23/24/25/41
MKKNNNSTCDEPKLLWLRHFSAGVCAGGTSRTCTAPIDRLRTFFQGNLLIFFFFVFILYFGVVYGLDTNGRMTIRTTLASMIKEGGIRSLWRGNLMNVIKVSPETGLRLMSYEAFKRLLGQTATHEVSIYEKFICGSAAGFTASALIYPMKTIKVRDLI